MLLSTIETKTRRNSILHIKQALLPKAPVTRHSVSTAFRKYVSALWGHREISNFASNQCTPSTRRFHSVYDALTAQMKLPHRAHGSHTVVHCAHGAHTSRSYIVLTALISLNIYGFNVFLYFDQHNVFANIAIYLDCSRQFVILFNNCTKSRMTCNMFSKTHILHVSKVHLLAFKTICFSWVFLNLT